MEALCRENNIDLKLDSLSFLTLIIQLQSHLAFCILHLAFCVLKNTLAIKFAVHSNCCRNISIYWENISLLSSKGNQISCICDLSYHLSGNSLIYCFPQQINMVMVYVMVYPCLKFYLSTAVTIQNSTSFVGKYVPHNCLNFQDSINECKHWMDTCGMNMRKLNWI